jgi:hypothetical protein
LRNVNSAGAIANKTTQGRTNRWRAGTPIYSRHNKDDLDNDMPALINDMLADTCGLIVKTIALIPPERDAERLSACAFVLEVINEAIERMVNADPTQH